MNKIYRYFFLVFVVLLFEACHLNHPSFSIGDSFSESEFCSRCFLMIPVDESNGESDVIVTSSAGEQHLKIRLAETEIDYYVPLKCNGRTTIKIMGNHADYLFENMKFSRNLHYEYDAEYRPYIHFTAPQGWINDPNGLIYINGEYHLYYQHNPYGAKWGNMTWGHATTKDFIHWEHHGDALFPDKNGNAFSGCCIQDCNNVSGFGENALLAFYTSDAPSGQTQSLAYSIDGGKTFEKYEGNPVLTSDVYRDFRDPKVFWHEPSSKWVMALSAAKTIQFYSSSDLKTWNHESIFTYPDVANDAIVWECPDIFPMNDSNGVQKWVMINSNLCHGGSMSKVRYYIGDFDGHSFIPETSSDHEINLVDYGPDFYASATYANAPDGRTIMATWMNGVAYAGDTPYDGGFRGAHTLPRDLFLYSDGDKWYVGSTVCEEVRRAAKSSETIGDLTVEKGETSEIRISDTPYCIRMKMEDASVPFVLQFSAEEKVELEYCPSKRKMSINRSESGDCSFSDRFVKSWDVDVPFSNEIELEIWVDRTSVECFLNGGKVSSTFQVFPSKIYDTVKLTSLGSRIDVSNIEITRF